MDNTCARHQANAAFAMVAGRIQQTFHQHGVGGPYLFVYRALRNLEAFTRGPNSTAAMKLLPRLP